MENSQPHYLGGAWVASSGPGFSSFDPSTGEVIWQGNAADKATIDRAAMLAREAFASWSRLTAENRAAVVTNFAVVLKKRAAELSEAISREVGKPPWEAAMEVQAMVNKVDISLDAQARRNADFSLGGAHTRFRPHGVVAVLGPFNFPGHLPNGHIVPALLAGNAVIFKPSNQAPLVAELTARCWEEAGLPAGVFGLLQGEQQTSVDLAAHPELDGLFFTGSSRVGVALNRAFAENPAKILALEMGGNNPLVVHDPADLDAAAYLVAQSAFATAGQRCTCARRLILTDSFDRKDFIQRLAAVTSRLVVGPPFSQPEPFMGPVISEAAALRCVEFQDDLAARGGRVVLAAKALKSGTGLVSPSLVDVTAVSEIPDEEIFGPLLQIRLVDTLADAIEESNRTRYGLAAGLLGSDVSAYEEFRGQVRAGIINWNKPLTGASSAAPFGGVGLSGNHRPSAYFAADYCSYPVASMEDPALTLPAKPVTGLPLQ